MKSGVVLMKSEWEKMMTCKKKTNQYWCTLSLKLPAAIECSFLWWFFWKCDWTCGWFLGFILLAWFVNWFYLSQNLISFFKALKPCHQINKLLFVCFTRKKWSLIFHLSQILHKKEIRLNIGTKKSPLSSFVWNVILYNDQNYFCKTVVLTYFTSCCSLE